MLTPQQLDHYPDSLVKLWAKTEQSIIADMARRINGFDLFIPSARWQLAKVKEMGQLEEYILQELAAQSYRSWADIKALMTEAGMKTLAFDDHIYQRAGLTPMALKDSPALQGVLMAGLAKTNGLFRNLTNSAAAAGSRQFERALDLAYMQVTTGAFSHTEAIKHAIKQLSRGGLEAVVYDSGRVEHLDVAVRRAVLTGVNQTAAKMQITRAEEMGCDLVEVTAHAGARPSHADWQGKIYSRSGKSEQYDNFEHATGYGTGAGLCGWNCHHNFFPYFEGLSEPAYTKEELERFETGKDYEYNGIKMTEYEATQKQRYIERQQRRWKREYTAMEAAGLDTAESASKIAHWNSVQKDFLEKTGLKRQHDREQLQGFGKSQAGKIAAINKKAYNDMVKHLGQDHVPSVDDFKKMGYNSSEYKQLINKYKIAKQAAWEQDIVDKAAVGSYKAIATAEDIPQWLKDQALRWTDEEKAALAYYTSHNYSKINGYLRGQETAGKMLQSKINQISNAIKKTSIEESIVVWRGTYLNNFIESDWLKKTPIEHWLDREISDKAFSSTAIVKNGAFNGEVFMKINIPKGSNGAYISEISEFKDEYEVLLQKGSVFRIKDVSQQDGKIFIEVVYKGVGS